MLIDKDTVLENESVLLRPLEESAFAHLLPFVQHEPEIWKYSLLQIEGEESLRQYIAQAEASAKAGTEFAFLVFDKVKQAYAGTTRFYDIQPVHKTMQLGYTWYGKAFQGTHVNKNCKFLMLRFAFDFLGMERIEFRADAENKRSIAAMQRIGCQKEGILRNHLARPDGTRRSSIVLSILQTKWATTVRANLEALLTGTSVSTINQQNRK